MSEDEHARLRIGDFDFDRQAAKLLRDGQPVKIQPQPLRVLQLLIERRGQIVSREELHRHIWNGATFVEFDQGLNYCIRHLRQALGDDAMNPTYIETLPKQGYRLIADASGAANGAIEPATELKLPAPAAPSPSLGQSSPGTRRVLWFTATAICIVLAFLAVAVYLSVRPHTAGVQYTQLTDFDDSAVSPALSPDGRMLAFFRSEDPFFTMDAIWLKMLPNGEAKLLTDDRRYKWGITFSLDGSQIFYTAVGETFMTYAVSVLGGEPHLVLNNAAGLSQIGPEQVLFSRIRSGLHMGLVMGTLTNQHLRDVYFPANEQGMVHYSFASPDKTTAIVVEMDGVEGRRPPCRIVSINNSFSPRQVGPTGSCTSAAWSPDGLWMYFTVDVEGTHHIWRQRYPNGVPRQITSGPAWEDGLVMESGGHSLITSLGVRQNSLWLHDRNGDRPVAAEGELLGWQVADNYPPQFTADGQYLYYLERAKAGSRPELWRVEVNSGKPEPVLPGISMLTYDLSRDGTQVLYSNPAGNGALQIGIAALDKSSPATQILVPGAFRPYFGPEQKILFLHTDKNRNYLEEMNRAGSGRRRVFPFPIVDILGISPTRRWLFIAKESGSKLPPVLAVSLRGDPPRTLCTFDCISQWSPDGKWLFVPVVYSSGNNPGRTLAIPIGPDDTLPHLPEGGIKPDSQPGIIQGAQSINRDGILPGVNLSQYAHMKGGVHRNLYRVSLP